jgi:hypothetical protein
MITAKTMLVFMCDSTASPINGRGIDLRENESVSVDPVGVLGVEGHELVEKNVSDRGHAHRGTGVTRVGFGGRIDLWEHLMSVWSIIDYPLTGDSRCMWRLNKRSQSLEARWRGS